MARQLAPGLKREKFAFESWGDHQPELWQQLRAEALGARKAIAEGVTFVGSDTDERTLQRPVKTRPVLAWLILLNLLLWMRHTFSRRCAKVKASLLLTRHTVSG